VRHSANISQDGLVELAGLDRSFVSRLERGVANPAYLTLLKIAGGLDVDISALLRDGDVL